MIPVEQLRQIISIPVTTQDADLEPYLTTASLIRTEDLSKVTSLSSARCDMIELYLAAHYAAIGIEYGGLQSWSTGQSKETYKAIQSQLTDLRSTRYGQAALTLDTSGTLASKYQAIVRAKFASVRPVNLCPIVPPWMW